MAGLCSENSKLRMKSKLPSEWAEPKHCKLRTPHSSNLHSGCGMVWCGVVWCGVVWCGVVWCGMVWCRVLRVNTENGRITMGLKWPDDVIVLSDHHLLPGSGADPAVRGVCSGGSAGGGQLHLSPHQTAHADLCHSQEQRLLSL